MSRTTLQVYERDIDRTLLMLRLFAPERDGKWLFVFASQSDVASFSDCERHGTASIEFVALADFWQISAETYGAIAYIAICLGAESAPERNGRNARIVDHANTLLAPSGSMVMTLPNARAFSQLRSVRGLLSIVRSFTRLSPLVRLTQKSTQPQMAIESVYAVLPSARNPRRIEPQGARPDLERPALQGIAMRLLSALGFSANEDFIVQLKKQ